jgi:UDP-N-acetylglucosamine 4,6-dehydratase/5-epimerase
LIVNKKILIFGGTGSLGRKLCSSLSKDNKIWVYSRDELKQWTMKNDFKRCKSLSFIIGDIRNKSRVSESIRLVKPDIVIIAAALKHVDVCEIAPGECIQTNILGTQNVVSACRDLESFVENMTVLFVSTDKACEPVNVYGMSKAISERIVTNAYQSSNKINFIAVRYGNVLESRGSIIPLFKYQSLNENFLTLTSDKMTRFVMTLNESVDLIINAILKGESGDLWIPKLKAMKIVDLAEIYSEMSGKEIKKIDIRPGEKLDESLISSSESPRVVDAPLAGYYIVKPITNSKHFKEKNVFSYTSADDIMTKENLKLYLEKLGVLSAKIDDFKGQKIEEIRK